MYFPSRFLQVTTRLSGPSNVAFHRQSQLRLVVGERYVINGALAGVGRFVFILGWKDRFSVIDKDGRGAILIHRDERRDFNCDCPFRHVHPLRRLIRRRGPPALLSNFRRLSGGLRLLRGRAFSLRRAVLRVSDEVWHDVREGARATDGADVRRLYKGRIGSSNASGDYLAKRVKTNGGSEFTARYGIVESAAFCGQVVGPFYVGHFALTTDFQWGVVERPVPRFKGETGRVRRSRVTRGLFGLFLSALR